MDLMTYVIRSERMGLLSNSLVSIFKKRILKRSYTIDWCLIEDSYLGIQGKRLMYLLLVQFLLKKDE